MLNCGHLKMSTAFIDGDNFVIRNHVVTVLKLECTIQT